MYRPGQPNWEYTIWKSHEYSANQILRGINFGHFEAPKTAILIFWAALNFEFLETFESEKLFQKSKFKACKIVKTAVFDHLK